VLQLSEKSIIAPGLGGKFGIGSQNISIVANDDDSKLYHKLRCENFIVLVQKDVKTIVEYRPKFSSKQVCQKYFFDRMFVPVT